MLLFKYNCSITTHVDVKTYCHNMLDRISEILIKLGKKYRRVRRMFLNTNLKKKVRRRNC